MEQFVITFDEIRALCDELSVPLHIVPTEINQIVFVDRKETNPCSLCAKLRRGALNANARELGCNKVALGHHKDDALETLMLSISYDARFWENPYIDKEDIVGKAKLKYYPIKDFGVIK